MVVSKHTGYPGKGYYENAARLGHNVVITDDPSHPLNVDFFKAQLLGLGLDPFLQWDELYADIEVQNLLVDDEVA
jgi:hypothetical protein